VQTKTTPAEDTQDAAAAEEQPLTDKQKLEEDAITKDKPEEP